MKTKFLQIFFFAAVFLLIISKPVFSLPLDYEKAFSLNPINDRIQLPMSVLLTGSAIISDNVFHIKSHEYNDADQNVNDLQEIERFFMQPYRRPLHILGTGTVALALGSPILFAPLLPTNE